MGFRNQLVAGLAVIVVSITTIQWLLRIFRKKLPVYGKTVVITGGSQGLGLSLAKQLAARGANVTIIARQKSKLEDALRAVEGCQVRDDQWFKSISADVTVPSEIDYAVDACGAVDVMFCCAGAAHPRFFKDMSAEQIRAGVETNYLSAAFSAHAALRNMVDHKTQGTILFVSSVVAFVTLAGYAEYSPSKAAIRSLADSLRQECLLYGIRIACACPATIKTPGFQEENKTKPEITRTLEGPDAGQDPDVVARKILQGLDRGEYLITTDFMGMLMRSCAWGGSVRGHIISDTILSWLFALVWPVVTLVLDGIVLRHKPPVPKSK